MNARKILKISLSSGEVLEVFDTMKQAANDVRGNSSSICNVCTGKGLSAYGFAWQYATSEKQGDFVADLGNKGIKNKRVFKIDAKTGALVEVFNSCTDASKSVKLTRQAISNACLTGKVSRGYIWTYVHNQ